MSRPPQTSRELSREQVSSFRLRHHHLSEPAPRRALLDVLSDMGGAQAQVLSAAFLSAAVRTEGIRAEDLEAALGPERTVARAWAMRRTLFLLPVRDLAIFARGSARRAEKEVRFVRNRGVSEARVEEIVTASLEALSEPSTTGELATKVGRALGVPVRGSPAYGWGHRHEVPGVRIGDLTYPAGYLLHLAGARGVVAYGPARDGETTYVRADAWFPRWRDLPQEKAEEELLRRYLRSYGPATARDFVAWTRMTLADANRVWSRIERELVPVTVDGTTAWLHRESVPEIDREPSGERCVRLLPYFDSYLLGHDRRDHLVDPSRLRRIYRPQGWVSPVLLVDGRIRGTWTHRIAGRRFLARVHAFAPLDDRTRAQVREEAARLGDFVGCTATSLTVA